MKNKNLSVKSIAFFLAFLIMLVSCSQYDQDIQHEGLSIEQQAALKNAALEYVQDLKNGKIDFTKNQQSEISTTNNDDINNALSLLVSDNLTQYETDVLNYMEWNNEEQAAIEAIFIVLNTFKANFTSQDAAKIGIPMTKSCGETEIPWFAPLAFWGVCAVVGLLTVGVAGVACAGLVAARTAYCTYHLQN